MTQTNQSNGALRIALFSGNYNYVMDGPVRALNRLVRFVLDKDVEVRIYAPTSKKSFLPYAGTLVSVPSFALPGRGEYRLGLGLPQKTRNDIDDFAPDLIHVAAPDWIGHSAVKYAKKRDIPILGSYHTRFDTYARYYGGAALEKYITKILLKFYNQCDLVMPPTSSMSDELIKQGFSAPMRIWSRGVEHDVFNPNKRDMKWRKELGFTDDDKVILFVGRVVLEKGIDFFCDVLDALEAKGPAFKVLVVGDGPAQGYFAKRQPKAKFIGYQSGDDLARAYASSDIFFNPSISEGFGNVTLEAMAAQLPCVCAVATGSNSLVLHEKTGYLLPFNETDVFAKALADLIDDDVLRTKMGKAGRKRSKDHDWDQILGFVLSCYHELVQGHAKAGSS